MKIAICDDDLVLNRNNFFVISFENPLSTPVEVRSNSLIASTKTTGDHGFGLLNIKNTAEKNGGYIEVDANKHFILTVVIRAIRKDLYNPMI